MAESPEHYERLHAIFESARALAPGERAVYLQERCGGDENLRRELEDLLGLHDDDSAFSEVEIEGTRRALEGVATTNTPEAPWVADRIGDYRIVRRIAEGGMGVVYEAEQDSPRRRIALKVVHPLFATSTRLKRFRQEAELLGRLQHPGIAQIHEAGTFDGERGPQPYFAMEYVEGSNLATHAKRTALSVAGRIQVLALVCDAVQHAHTHGVIHRDLKPDNILVDGRGQPKVLDFGVARAAEGSTVLTTLVTEEGDLLGTIAYMAPEQLEGRIEAITPRVDVYALGAIAFELLAGRLPHDVLGLPLAAAIQIVRDREPPRLGTLRPELAGEVETIVGMALEKERERRYASAAALAADLRAFVENRPIRARPPSRIYRAAKFARRNKALVGGTLATLAAIIVGSIASLVFALRAEENAGRATESARQARQDERRTVAGLLQSTLNRLEAGDYWDAALMYQRVGIAAAGFERQLVARLLPPLVPERYAFESTPYWVDEEHLALNDPRGGIVVLEIGTWRETQRILDGESVQGTGGECQSAHATRGSVRPWRSQSRLQETLLVDVESGRVERRPGRVRTASRPGGSTLEFTQDTDHGDWRVSVEGEVVARIPAPDPADHAMFVSPGGERVVIAARYTGVLRTYDALTGTLLGERTDAQRTSCTCVIFRSEDELLTRDRSSRLTLHRVDDLSVVRHYENIVGDECSKGATSPDGSLFAHARRGDPVEVFDLESGELVFSQFVRLGHETGKPKFSPSGRRLLVIARNVGATVLDLNEQLPSPSDLGTDRDPRATTHHGHERFVYDVAMSPDGWLVASASVAEPAVRLWDSATGETLATLDKPIARSFGLENRGHLLAFSPDGRRLLATVDGGSSAVLLVWDLLTGSASSHELPPSEGSHLSWLDRFLEELGPAPAMSLGRKGFLLGDGTALGIQQAGQPVPVGERWRELPFSSAEALSLSPDGKRTVVASMNKVCVLERESAKLLLAIPSAARTLSVAWSPSGRLIAAGGANGRIRLIDHELGTEVLNFRAHDDYVFDLAWTPDGKRLVSASGDTTVRVWDTRPQSERDEERSAYEARLTPLREFDDKELLHRFGEAATPEERGAVIRVALERR